MYEVIATESHIWLVTELCTGGELFDYLVERGRLLEGEARRVFGELVVAVGTLHRKGTVHRDLKLENVFLDGECQVKLGDLGFAREWSRGQKLLDTFCGTTGYASPEMLQGRKYSGEGGFPNFCASVSTDELSQRPTFGRWASSYIPCSAAVCLLMMTMRMS